MIKRKKLGHSFFFTLETWKVVDDGLGHSRLLLVSGVVFFL
jgi:hypothetical protein